MNREKGGSTDATVVGKGPTDRASPPAELSTDQLARLTTRFHVKKLLGSGGMGVVVQVHDRVLERDVAVKLLFETAEADARTRFLREARAAGMLRHPGIVTVHDIDPDGGFIVLELVTGGSLADRLKREPRLPVDEVRRIARALLSALAAAHAAGIVHRDVKPGNILFDDAGTVKLTDFGVASFGDSELTTTGTRIGTPDYMAPEQLRGRTCDLRADLYAAGATLFEAATGSKLHDEQMRDPAQAIRDATGDDALARAIAHAVQEHANDRPATAAALAAELDARPPRRRLVPALAIAGALAVATTGAFVLHARADRKPSVDALLERGIHAAESNDLETASTLLQDVIAREPNRAEAYHYLALVLEWEGKPVNEITAAIEKGLSGDGLTPPVRAFLDGFKLLVARRHREALAFFRDQAQRYPGDRNIEYGLFEALFHTGDPAASIAMYRTICTQAPHFRLGMFHPLAYYIASGNAAGIEWAIHQADAHTLEEWRPNALIAHRDYAAAVADLEHTIATTTQRTPTRALAQLAQAHALAGQLDEADATANQLATRDRTSAALPLWALAVARGRPVGEWRDIALRAPLTEPVGITRVDAWLQLGTFVVVGEPALLRTIADGLATAIRDEPGEIIQADIGLAIVGGSLADGELIARATRNGYAEAIAITEAFAADHEGKLDEAAKAWRRAIAAAEDGRYFGVEEFFLARAAHQLGDRAQLVEACREVIAPHVFSWTWAATAETCRGWLAE